MIDFNPLCDKPTMFVGESSAIFQHVLFISYLINQQFVLLSSYWSLMNQVLNTVYWTSVDRKFSLLVDLLKLQITFTLSVLTSSVTITTWC